MSHRCIKYADCEGISEPESSNRYNDGDDHHEDRQSQPCMLRFAKNGEGLCEIKSA